MVNNKPTLSELTEIGEKLVQLGSSVNELSEKRLSRNLAFTDFRILKYFNEQLGMSQGQRLYLTVIADSMNMAMPDVSKLVQSLQSKGLIYWNHETGREGTFITLSEIGSDYLKDEHDRIRAFCQDAVDTMGYDKVMQLIELLEELNHIVQKL